MGDSQRTVSAGPASHSCPNCGSVYIGPRQENCARCGYTFPSSEFSFRPGEIIDGKYEVIGLLGVGGMGEVFKARHVHLETVRCIKVMKRDLMKDETFRHRFLREAKAATRVHHPNVAVVHDFSSLEDGTYYMVNEFIDGISIRQWISRSGRVPPGLAVLIASQVLSGLHHCHTRGLLHRDISADNIMMTIDHEERPTAKIIDLGIAKLMEGPANELTHSTQVGLFVGNPKYSSPEQLGQLPEGEELDGRTDLYSLGIVMYEMILGTPPFFSRTPQGYVMQHLTMQPSKPSSVDPTLKLPEEFEEIIVKALSKKRGERWSSAREMSRSLRPVLRSIDEKEVDRFGDSIVEILPSRQIEAQLRETRSHRKFRRTTQIDVPIPESADSRRETAEKLWNGAEKTGTVEAWVQFADVAPEGEKLEQARQKINELSLQARIRELEGDNDLEGLRELAESESGTTGIRNRIESAIRDVERMLSNSDEKAAWDQAWEQGTPAAWSEYIRTNPGSSRVDDAKEYEDESADFEKATQAASEQGWRDYLSKWPEGRHLLEAEIQLGQAKQARLDREKADWDEAFGVGTPVAWQRFLEIHPTAKRIEEAQQHLLESRDFQKALKKNTESSWKRYLDQWFESSHAPEARKRLQAIVGKIDAAMFAAAATRKSAEALRAFVEEYPDSSHVGEARNLLEQWGAWEAANSEDTWEAFDALLRDFPNHPMAKEAKDRLPLLEEDRALDEAIRDGSSKAFRAFLRRYPDSAQRSQVQGFFEEALAFERTNGKEGLEQFVKVYPEGLHTMSARIKLDEVREALAFEEAANSNSIDSWRDFLDHYSSGELSATAAARLEELEELRGAEEKEADALKDIPRLEQSRNLASLEAMSIEFAGTDVEPLARQAAERIRIAERRRAEELDWQDADKVDSTDAWNIYLRIHTDSQRSAIAEHRKSESTDFESARGKGTIDGWRDFIRKWPDGSHRLEAEQQLDRLSSRDDDDVLIPATQNRAMPSTVMGHDLSPPAGTVMMEEIPPTPKPLHQPIIRHQIGGLPGSLSTAPPPVPKKKTSTLAVLVLVAIMVLVVVVVAIVGIRLLQDKPVEPPAVPSTTLVIDAVPWGRVVSVSSSEGVEMLSEGHHYTPLFLQLEPGSYRVEMVNPNVPDKVISQDINLTLGMKRVLRERFETLSPGTYFEEAGW